MTSPVIVLFPPRMNRPGRSCPPGVFATAVAPFSSIIGRPANPGCVVPSIITGSELAGHGSSDWGLQTISPQSELPWPASSDPVIIDGTTQPGFAGRPIIELNGATAVANTPGGQDLPGLFIRGGNSTITGLVINHFRGYEIEILFNGRNVIAGDFIGTDITGTLGGLGDPPA